MSFLDVLKRGASSTARGIASTVKAAVKPEEQATPAPAPEPQDKAPRGFTLPDLDPNDEDYEHRQQIHDAIMNLDKQWTEAMPHIDYQGHYNKLREEMGKEPKARSWNALSKLAVALGTQNPDRPYDPNLGLAQMEEKSQSDLAGEKKTFDENMSLRKEALAGHIRQLLDEGKFRQALGQLNAQEQLGVTKSRFEHGLKMKEEEAKSNAKKEVARIQAQAALDRANARITYLKEQGGKLKLSPSDRASMEAEFRSAQNSLNEIKKQWQEGMLSDEQVEIAEEEHRQEMKRIHDYYEDRELGERGPEAGPRTPTAKPKTGMKPNAADPWFAQ